MSKDQTSPILDFETLRKALDMQHERGRNVKARGLPSIEANAEKKTARIYILDEISWWTGNDALSVKNRLDELDAETIEVILSSPGGNVFEGTAIYNLLLSHPARIEVSIHGVAGSIASVIALAGDHVRIANNAFVFIHEASGGAWGRAEDLLMVAEWLEKINEGIVATYETRTKMERADIIRDMDKETFYTAAEAKARGFVDEIVEPVRLAAKWEPGASAIPAALRDLLKAEPEDEEEEEPETLTDFGPAEIAAFAASLPSL